MTDPRSAALTVIQRCRRDGAWSAHVLDAMHESGELSARDAALAARLSMEVLQNDRYLDHYIDFYCHSPKLEPRVRDLLRLGACQILLLDKIPGRAAVYETVELCKQIGLSRSAGLVNAVLRRLEENRERLPELPGKGTPAYLALRYSQSDWLASKLVEQRGYAFAEAFFAASLQPAPTDLQINTLKTSVEHYGEMLRQQHPDAQLSSFPSACFSLRGGSVAALPGYRDGLFYVQDRAAAMAVEIAAPSAGMRVLDACAAPGGKSFAAAIRMQDEGRILSCDIHGKKLSLIEEGARRLNLSCIETEEKDASEDEPAWHEAFDLVIADLPCSGFGVMRKKPELKGKKQEDCARLPALQEKILDNLSQYLAVGGTFLVATCTVLQEENELLISSFLQKHRHYAPWDFSVEGRSSKNGCYTFWPHIDGTDGFFAARLKRIA